MQSIPEHHVNWGIGLRGHALQRRDSGRFYLRFVFYAFNINIELIRTGTNSRESSFELVVIVFLSHVFEI